MESSSLIYYGLMIFIILIINWLLKDKIINFIRKITNSASDNIEEQIPIKTINFVYRG